MTWTDERVETLRTMWAEGKSASQIAKELGGITRNAVIGKVHRLGLSNRAGATDQAEEADPASTTARVAATPETEGAAPAEAAAVAADAPAPQPVAEPSSSSAPARAKATPVPAQPSIAPAPGEISPEALANLAEVERKAKRLTLMQLTERTCKWPVGDPATDDFWFCGLAAAPGKPYCDAHVAVAFQPMSSRRDRRTSNR